MDINLCIDLLGLNANRYRLNQSNTPHEIIEWDIDNPNTQPTQAELETAWTEYQAEQDSTQYARDRATDYPAIADQLDDIFHNGIDGWKATIQLTKDKYPKGGN
jgi:hypothetical protein